MSFYVTYNRVLVVGLLLLVLSGPLPAKGPKQSGKNGDRQAYLDRVTQANLEVSKRSVGSLWSPDAALQDLAADATAKNLNDVIVIQVIQQTTAQSNGSVSGDRGTTYSSAITGLPAHLSTGGVNPLVGAQSSQTLKGAGQTSSDSSIRTTLSGRVIAVLPNGLLVVEAQRELSFNKQRELMTVRGVIRPADISSANSIPSTLMSDLQIELQGKGVVSDFTRAPNPFVRVLMWFLGL